MIRGSFMEMRERLLSRNYSDLPIVFRGSVGSQNDGCCSKFYRKFLELWKNLGRDSAGMASEMGKPDPRKIVLSAKMGLALILVSLVVFFMVPPSDLSRYTLWAILTVLVVFEFSIGATLSRGFSRGLGVLLVGGVVLTMGVLSQLAGNWGVVIAIIGTAITDVRVSAPITQIFLLQ